MELGAHDAAALPRGTHAWSRPMDGTPSMSGERIGRASDATLATDILRRRACNEFHFRPHPPWFDEPAVPLPCYLDSFFRPLRGAYHPRPITFLGCGLTP